MPDKSGKNRRNGSGVPSSTKPSKNLLLQSSSNEIISPVCRVFKNNEDAKNRKN